MRKKDDSLRETLLDHARKLADEKGLAAVNIRAIAKQAGIANGTVYNYFASKDEILLALTEEYWRDALKKLEGQLSPQGDFTQQLAQIYGFLQERLTQDGALLMGSLKNVEADGRERMRKMEQVLRMRLVSLMERDRQMDPQVWGENFTKEDCADFIMMNLVASLQMQRPDIQFLLAILRRTLYL